jgi:hypothetical protein
MSVAGANAFSVQLSAEAGGQPGTVLETWFVSAATLHHYRRRRSKSPAAVQPAILDRSQTSCL